MTSPRARKTPSPIRGSALPSAAEIAAFVAESPGRVGKREIARAFGLKGGDRLELKRIMAGMEEEGALSRSGRRLRAAGVTPGVVLAEIVGRDRDGELLAEPRDRDGESGARITLLAGRRKGPGPAPGIGDRVLVRLDRRAATEAGPVGRVLKLLPRGRDAAIGLFRVGPDGQGRVESVDRKAAGRTWPVRAEDRAGAEDGDLVSVSVSETRGFGPGRAVVRERLGQAGTEAAVSLIAIQAHGIPHIFPPAALAEAEAARPATLAGREDWRDLPLVTIDPPDARDHDDAVWAAPDDDPANSGGVVVAVAIADVAAYVRPGSWLDREALARGNSVYFPGRVVPMLPERISNDLCSLVPGQPRPALAVRMVFSAQGRKLRHGFHRILMRSAAKLSYGQVQAALDGRPDDETGPILDGVLRPLWQAYRALAEARDARGPLALDLPERKVLLRPDGGVDRVTIPERLEAHRLIEEFMVAANVAAAETLEAARSPLIYRVHGEPTLEKMRALADVLASVGLKAPKPGSLRATAFNGILRQVAGARHETFVNEMVLRSQAQAEYAAENGGHFGLNLRRYAHFTSPIRRYADLVVHRALIRALGLGHDGLPDGTDPADLADVAEGISRAERRAMAAERETVDRLIAYHLADRVGATFEGRISGVTRAGLFVKLTETGADGLVPIGTIAPERLHHDERRHALVGTRSGLTFRLGDAVVVKLVEAAPVAGALRFELVEGGAAAPGRAREGRAREGRKAKAARAGRPVLVDGHGTVRGRGRS